MHRGRATTGNHSSPGGRSSRSAGHRSHPNHHAQVTGADGSFSGGSFSFRGGMSRGRRGNGRISPSSFPRCSDHKPQQHWVRKPSPDESFHAEGLQQNRNASNASGNGSNQSGCFVASDPTNEGDAVVLSECSRVAAEDPVNLDFSLKVNIASQQNESQASLQSGAKGMPSKEQCASLPSKEQCAKSAGSTVDPEHSENPTVTQPFDICPSRTGLPMLKPSLHEINRQKRNETKRAIEGQGKVLEPGMILLKGNLSMDDQVKIVKLSRRLGLGPGGFYQPSYRDGAKLMLKMMCLGKNWDPNKSQYSECRPVDNAKPPDIPNEFHQLVERAMEDSYALFRRNCEGNIIEDILPRMSPDICIINFYSASGRLGLHQDKDESEGSRKKGLPVVSFSIGDTGEFLYGETRDEKNAKKVLLESGDVLIFGGKSRHIFHGVRSVQTETAPKSLLQETNLRAGRLNLTFRQY